MANDEYLRILEQYRSHSTYESEYVKTLDELERDQVDFSTVRSCIAFGAGSGDQEMEVARRFLPTLHQFTAVDPDRRSLAALQGYVKDGRLAAEAETTVVEKTIQAWNGSGDRVDAAMLFNVFFHVDAGDRRELMRKLLKCLNPDGIVIIIEASSIDTTGILRLLERLGTPIDSRMYGEIEKGMSAGFSLQLARDIKSTLDLSHPSKYVIKFVQSMLDNGVSEQEVRTAINEVYSNRAMLNYTRTLAVFRFDDIVV